MKGKVSQVLILNEVVDKKDFPVLYKWALENPRTLEVQLKSIADRWHEGNIKMAMVNFEMDLEII